MITLTSALLSALVLFEQIFGPAWMGAIRISLTEKGFLSEAIATYSTDVSNEVVTKAGSVVISDTPSVPQYLEVTEVELPVLDPRVRVPVRVAFESALSALEKESIAYENYRSISITQQNGNYEITFPLDLPPGDRGADYAYKIVVDGQTGEVINLLTAS